MRAIKPINRHKKVSKAKTLVQKLGMHLISDKAGYRISGKTDIRLMFS
jgi:hypothetical protein